MNEELKNQLTQFLEKALDITNKGIEATGEQTPALLQEIIQWQLFSSISYLVLFTTISIFGFILSYYLYKEYKRRECDEHIIMLVISSFVSLFIFFASLLANLPTLIKVLTSPRLVILEYLKGLL